MWYKYNYLFPYCYYNHHVDFFFYDVKNKYTESRNWTSISLFPPHEDFNLLESWRFVAVLYALKSLLEQIIYARSTAWSLHDLTRLTGYAPHAQRVRNACVYIDYMWGQPISAGPEGNEDVIALFRLCAWWRIKN